MATLVPLLVRIENARVGVWGRIESWVRAVSPSAIVGARSQHVMASASRKGAARRARLPWHTARYQVSPNTARFLQERDGLDYNDRLMRERWNPGEPDREPNQADAVVAVNHDHDGRVCELVLGGKRGNLITERLVGEFRDAMRSAATDRRLKLIIISGEKDHFSYGADVGEHLPERIAEVLPLFHALIGEMLECDVPTLARVNGYCLGGGFEMALACSMLWCDKTARLGVPEISLGVFPPVAAVLLPLKTSRTVAADLMLTGRVITGPEAHTLGIANTVMPKSLFTVRLHDFIVTYILPKSASSLRHANAALMADVRKRYREEIPVMEKLYLEKLMHTHDAVEGAQAFLDKRVPDWRDE
jgi:cyclohexa-1,5-dienecarbonyl-CoA hydratase